MEGNGELTFGSALRKAREGVGLTVEELAGITRVQSKYLQALEGEDWDRVPAGVIGRGFVRLVAKQLGAPGDSLPTLYREARGEGDSAPDHALPEADWEVNVGRGRRGGSRTLLGASAAVLLLIGLWFVTSWQSPPGDGSAAPDERSQPTAQQGSPEAAPVVAPQPVPAAPEPPPAETSEEGLGPHRLAIQAVEKTWVRVIVDGSDAQDHEFAPGEKLTYEAPGAVTVRLGNAAGVRMFWDGEPLKLAGESGAVVTLSFPEALEQLRP